MIFSAVCSSLLIYWTIDNKSGITVPWHLLYLWHRVSSNDSNSDKSCPILGAFHNHHLLSECKIFKCELVKFSKNFEIWVTAHVSVNNCMYQIFTFLKNTDTRRLYWKYATRKICTKLYQGPDFVVFPISSLVTPRWFKETNFIFSC